MSFLANVSSPNHSPRNQTPLSPAISAPSPRFAALFSSPPPQQPARNPSTTEYTIEELSDSETYPLETQILHPYATEEPSDTASESDATSEYPDSDTAIAERLRHLRCNRTANSSPLSGTGKRVRALESDTEDGTRDWDTISERPRLRRRIRAPDGSMDDRDELQISSLNSDIESEMSDAPPQQARPFWTSADLMDVDGQAA